MTASPGAKPQASSGRGRLRRLFLWGGIVLLLALGLLYLAFRLSPWPTVFIIQQLFSQGDQQAQALLERHIPAGIVTRTDLTYGPGPDDRFDISLPPNASTPLPAVVWVHGGAWIAGHKEGVSNYLKVLAGEGFATIAVEYSTGMGTTYPTPVHQINDALRHIVATAGELGIDPDRILLAGDSAGAQLAAQVALIITDPAYATAMGMTPGLSPDQLRGAILASGAYDLKSIDFEGDWAWFLNTVLWAYTGAKDFLEDGQFDLASVQQHVGPAFPPAFITSGNGDPLAPQAYRLANTLEALGVDVETLFFPADHAPALPHEYQFNLDLPEGQQAFDAMVGFARTRLAP